MYRYETQPEESLLRTHRREPGSMYSGDLPGSARTEELWTGITRWRKVAWRDEAAKDDYSELERLLAHVRGSTIAEFADFARHEIDVHAFAQFDALDVAFGCDQHNFRENHKLYFDPYRGRWEPIAWGFRGFEHDAQFNRVENPLLLRLKFVPGYLALRDRLLYEFLMGEGSGAGVHARGLELWRRIGPELAADPWWDAYRLLPRVDEFLRELVRPMTLQRALLVFESELTTYERRRAFLIEELRKNPLWLRVRTDAAAPNESQLDVIVDGQAGVALQSVRAEFPADCTAPGFSLLRDGHELAAASPGGAAEFPQAIALYPAQRIAERPDPTSGRGTSTPSWRPSSTPSRSTRTARLRGSKWWARTSRPDRACTRSLHRRTCCSACPSSVCSRIRCRRSPRARCRCIRSRSPSLHPSRSSSVRARSRSRTRASSRRTSR